MNAVTGRYCATNTEDTRDEVDCCRVTFKEVENEHNSSDNEKNKSEEDLSTGEKCLGNIEKNEHRKKHPSKSERFRKFHFKTPEILRSKSMDALFTHKTKQDCNKKCKTKEPNKSADLCKSQSDISKLEESKFLKSLENDMKYKKNVNETKTRKDSDGKSKKKSKCESPKTKETVDDCKISSDLLTRSEEFGSSVDISSGAGKRAMHAITKGIRRLLRRHTSSFDISTPDPEYRVAYLGNVITGLAKGDGCEDKPLATLWRNYAQGNRPNVAMSVSVTTSGLKASTRQHGLTEYWAHRVTHCCAPKAYPRVFCWVYRHEGRRLKHELRCHAVLCSRESVAAAIASRLRDNITTALADFKREKISRQNARLSLANSVYDNPSLPRRKILLSVGNNYKPPLERSKSAPKLMAIEEIVEEEEETPEYVPQQRCCQNSDIFPSYTLGRRRCPRGHSLKRHRPRVDSSISCSESQSPTDEDKPSISHEENEKEDQEEISIDARSENSSIPETPTLTITSDDSRTTDLEYHDADDDVFFDQDAILNILASSNYQNKPNCSITIGINLDSDEGSISSGCETASTVTASDVENVNSNIEKLSEENPSENPDEVMLTPFGETGDITEYRKSFRKSFNSCPLVEIHNEIPETYTLNVEIDVAVESDGEFSDESGYAELLDAKCKTIMQSKPTVVV